MTTGLAARYLSLDENSLRIVAGRGGVGPVDLLELERWRRTDLDRLVRSLVARDGMVAGSTATTNPARISEADLDRIAAKVRATAPVHNRRAFSIKDAAAACGISRSTLYRLVKEGQLQPIRIGSRTLIPGEQLDGLLQN